MTAPVPYRDTSFARASGALLVLLLASCQTRRPDDDRAAHTKPSTPPAVADASAGAPLRPAPVAWTVPCEKALLAAAKLTPVRRLGMLIEHCRPCGDLRPLLQWNTPETDGGPKTTEIEEAMVACDAYCSPDAKQRFTGELAAARGRSTNKPWRLLAETCKASVSAAADPRFASAPYFVLDRIARAAAADPTLAPLLAGLELPLPPTASTGAAFELPEAAVTAPDPGRIHVTVTQGELSVGELPRATLGAQGVTVELGATPYPGQRVTGATLASALARLAPGNRPVTLIAPREMPAQRLVDAVTAAGRPLVLAVAAAGGPNGWTLPGIVPVQLAGKPTANARSWSLGADPEPAITALQAATSLGGPHVIELGPAATVAGLAKLLGAFAYKDVQIVALRRGKR